MEKQSRAGSENTVYVTVHGNWDGMSNLDDRWNHLHWLSSKWTSGKLPSTSLGFYYVLLGTFPELPLRHVLARTHRTSPLWPRQVACETNDAVGLLHRGNNLPPYYTTLHTLVVGNAPAPCSANGCPPRFVFCGEFAFFCLIEIGAACCPYWCIRSFKKQCSSVSNGTPAWITLCVMPKPKARNCCQLGKAAAEN